MHAKGMLAESEAKTSAPSIKISFEMHGESAHWISLVQDGIESCLQSSYMLPE